ncbi:MAG: hypothetical protein ACOYZ6_01235 [Chloroflexota bacterium]
MTIRFIRKNFPPIGGWLAYLILFSLLYYLLLAGIFLLSKSFSFDPAPAFRNLLVIGLYIVAGYAGFALSVRWIVYPLAYLAKIPINRPKHWHLIPDCIAFYLTVLLLTLPIFALDYLQSALPSPNNVVELIRSGWQAIVSFFVYRHFIITDLYVKETEGSQESVLVPPASEEKVK